MSLTSFFLSPSISCGDFTKAKSERIDLDSKANRIKTVKIIAEVLFTETIFLKDSYHIEGIETGLILRSENSLVIKEVKRRIIQICTGSVEKTAKEVEDFISLYRRNNLPKFEERKTIYTADAIPPLPAPLQLKEQVNSLLRRNKIFYKQEGIINTLLTMFVQAIKAHEEDPSKMVFISSKSPAFSEINSNVDAINKSKISDHRINKVARASIRVLPNGLASITLPGYQVIKGGYKTIKRELTIDRDGAIMFMRRYKIQKEKRDKPSYLYFTQIIKDTAHIVTDRIVTPKLIYNTPKHSIEYLAKDCDMDIYDLLISYYIESDDHHLVTFHKLSIEKQTIALLDVMISSAKALNELHDLGLLHNDIKPENYLLSISEEKFNTYLCDLDFSCKKDQGDGVVKYFGTSHYIEKSAKKKTVHTDIHSLGKTFFLETQEKRKVICFAYALETLHKKKIQTFGEKSGSIINGIVNEVKMLSRKMQNAPESMALTTVITKLTKLRSLLIARPPNPLLSQNSLMAAIKKRKEKMHKRSQSI